MTKGVFDSILKQLLQESERLETAIFNTSNLKTLLKLKKKFIRLSKCIDAFLKIKNG